MFILVYETYQDMLDNFERFASDELAGALSADRTGGIQGDGEREEDGHNGEDKQGENPATKAKHAGSPSALSDTGEGESKQSKLDVSTLPWVIRDIIVTDPLDLRPSC